eukprot:SM000049S16698  [mRNA]  locus=s49:105585:106627:- [translate_table: standard]
MAAPSPSAFGAARQQPLGRQRITVKVLADEARLLEEEEYRLRRIALEEARHGHEHKVNARLLAPRMTTMRARALELLAEADKVYREVTLVQNLREAVTFQTSVQAPTRAPYPRLARPPNDSLRWGSREDLLFETKQAQAQLPEARTGPVRSVEQEWQEYLEKRKPQYQRPLAEPLLFSEPGTSTVVTLPKQSKCCVCTIL